MLCEGFIYKYIKYQFKLDPSWEKKGNTPHA